VTLSRRRLLGSGMALFAGLFGARAISLAAPAPSSAASPEAASPESLPAGYDPSAHRWGMVIDTESCIGCGRCVEACKLENHVPMDPEYNRTWVELHALTQEGGVFVAAYEGGIEGYSAETVEALGVPEPIRDAYFVPRLCMQCDNSPCTSICPVGATFRTEDGVVLVDDERCIGCGYCVVSCPYGARYIVPAGGELPNGYPGVADKCTFCYQRTTRGMLPACADVCPVEARIFGDLKDESSNVNRVLRQRRAQVIKPEAGTKPRVYYLGLENELG
jgi:tetrathionate reductase subunit B